MSAPLVYGAFWGSSSNDNTLEKVNEDIEKRTCLKRSIEATLHFLAAFSLLNLILMDDDHRVILFDLVS